MKKGGLAINTYSFDYNGRNSREFDLIIGGMNLSDDIPLGMSREVMAGTLNKYRQFSNYMGTSWSDVLEFDIALTKNPCDFPDREGMRFTEEEINEINAWLTSPEYPLLLKMYDIDLGEYTNYEYYGIFRNIQAQAIQGEIISLLMTFTTNSPFAWTPEIQKDFTCEGSISFVIKSKSAEYNKPIYPMIKIVSTNASASQITITNITDNNKAVTLQIPASSTVTIDTEKSMIYDENSLITLEDLGIEDVSNIYWPRLYYGDNNFSISGNFMVSFIWREPRKVGAY